MRWLVEDEWMVHGALGHPIPRTDPMNYPVISRATTVTGRCGPNQRGFRTPRRALVREQHWHGHRRKDGLGDAAQH